MICLINNGIINMKNFNKVLILLQHLLQVKFQPIIEYLLNVADSSNNIYHIRILFHISFCGQSYI